jgi:hypothetical protein
MKDTSREEVSKAIEGIVNRAESSVKEDTRRIGLYLKSQSSSQIQLDSKVKVILKRITSLLKKG